MDRVRSSVSGWTFTFWAIVAFSLFTLFQQPTQINTPHKTTKLATRHAYTHADLEVAHELEARTIANITKRDDYTCGPGRPCKNGACCGASGFCGYGPTYCGTGCVSNCNAKAECGQYAKTPGQKCPLNVCCSQYGFCGTTHDYCTTSCQSNCVEHPKPTGELGGGALSKVIGYYESWSARSKCHQESPKTIALDALTHLNFAFAYIDPSSFEITTMDSQTPESLFKDVTAAKEVNSKLKVFVSVGGWTFSDNGTSTQAVFGNIASTAGNRQKFASNVLKFMNNYGFDGLDIDWEYPGAPDRGGKPEDTANYVSLLQSLRSAFDGSGRKLELTFTVPSSYWYLRWFDLPNMIKYADWLNLMTYDLHGVWDRNNPIGNIVQGHTNLTEIQLAAELLWRVNVPPAKVTLGFGFYGRSFTLSDKSCTKPGCQFKGGAAPGPCTDTSGILAYYEIKDLIAQKKLTPILDTNAAVKYIVFDGDQWVSYDDDDTFGTKVRWANSIGFGGSLIWASDLDDDDFSAHSALLGRPIEAKLANNQIKDYTSKNLAGNIAGNTGLKCKTDIDQCREEGDCGIYGYRWVGGEKKNCPKINGKQSYHPICCPVDSAPKCQWRGSKSECNGQCHSGEQNIKQSSWGGIPREDGSDEGKCTRGIKTFCCESSDYDDLTKGCRMTGCSGGKSSCASNEYYVSTVADNCLIGRVRTLCCPKPANLYDCTWRAGKTSDCANAQCLDDEITIKQDGSGGGGYSDGGGSNGWRCAWGRKQSLCCKAHPPSKPSNCGGHSVCNDNAGYCGVIEPFEGDNDIAKRAGSKRGGDPREYDIILALLGIILTIRSRPYPIQSQYLTGPNGRNDALSGTFDLLDPNSCTNGKVIFNSPINAAKIRKGYETEHPVDLEVIQQFIRNTIAGTLPSGARPALPAISETFWNTWWRQHIPALGAAGNVGKGTASFDTMENRVFEAMGSKTNRYPLVLAATDINQVKARIFSLNNPFDPSDMRRYVTNSIASGNNEEVFLNNLRDVIAVFTYLQSTNVAQRFNHVRQTIRAQFQIVHQAVQAAQNERLTDWWTAFENDYFAYVAQHARDWVQYQIRLIRQRFNSASQQPGNLLTVLNALTDLENQLNDIAMPP